MVGVKPLDAAARAVIVAEYGGVGLGQAGAGAGAGAGAEGGAGAGDRGAAGERQGLILVHFSTQLERCRHTKAPYTPSTPPNTPLTWAAQSLRAPPMP